MWRKFKEWLSIITAKRPSTVVLFAILAFNVVFILLSAVLLANFGIVSTEEMSFIQATFYTITMILDAGCVQFIMEEASNFGIVLGLICLVIIIVGMISFTGAVIGYITNYISNFVDNSNSGEHKLQVSNHTVILNWNSRASEIVNDLLYCDTKQNVVVLVSSRKQEIKREIEERLADTVARDNVRLKEANKDKPFFERIISNRKDRLKMNVTAIVREGDVFSSKQLRDICLEKAKSIIILGNDINNTICKYEQKDFADDKTRGNPQTIKTLMQVADITAADYSDDNQKIIVEISDPWTAQIVDRIIKYKQVDEKCNIVPVPVNKILGQILSQFSIMPELNRAYKELFSNKGATFYSKELSVDDEIEYIKDFLGSHRHAIPLTSMEMKGKKHFYYSTYQEKLIEKTSFIPESEYSVDINKDYWMERRNVVILGHNSKCDDIMRGFASFVNEWSNILHILVIDDEEHLKKVDFYKKYDFVEKIVAAEIYDNQTITKTIDDFISANEEDTSVLILSDDSALNENIDANALANLIYVQEIVTQKVAENPDFDVESVDVIVEIIDPKHHDIVNNYSVNNVIISNRYISKMITQIGEKDALYEFYTDILTYDEEGSETYDSKEIYAKKVSRFFNKIPEKCTAAELIRAVFNASIDDSIPIEKQNPTIVLGYVKPGNNMVLFEGDQLKEMVELEPRDKLIVFSNH